MPHAPVLTNLFRFIDIYQSLHAYSSVDGIFDLALSLNLIIISSPMSLSTNVSTHYPSINPFVIILSNIPFSILVTRYIFFRTILFSYHTISYSIGRSCSCMLLPALICYYTVQRDVIRIYPYPYTPSAFTYF